MITFHSLQLNGSKQNFCSLFNPSESIHSDAMELAWILLGSGPPTLGIGFLSGEETCSIGKRLRNFSFCRSFKARILSWVRMLAVCGRLMRIRGTRLVRPTIFFYQQRINRIKKGLFRGVSTHIHETLSTRPPESTYKTHKDLLDNAITFLKTTKIKSTLSNRVELS